MFMNDRLLAEALDATARLLLQAEHEARWAAEESRPDAAEYSRRVRLLREARMLLLAL